MFTNAEQRAVFALLLHAALADGNKSEAERTALRRMTESFAAGNGTPFNPWALYQEVLGGAYPLAKAANDLLRPEARLLAYEMALGVCDTDGPPNTAEQDFLAQLRRALQLPAESAAAAGVVAQSMIADFPAGPSAVAPAVTPAVIADAARATTLAPIDTVALEKSILNHSILNAALELLPQSLATMAVVPLQMKMVYAVGKAHGYTLDRGHIRDFIATAGAGLAAQAVEGYARKLMGGLVGSLLGGGMMGGIGRAAVSTATGAAVTFAATYAIGHLSLRYYGGGRRMETAVLRDTYQKLLGDGQRLFGTHRSAIEQRAATLNPADVIQMVRQP
ncbi:MAG: GTPase [Opitutus sp.]|nr:GTPase [Opitutus sp.]